MSIATVLHVVTACSCSPSEECLANHIVSIGFSYQIFGRLLVLQLACKSTVISEVHNVQLPHVERYGLTKVFLNVLYRVPWGLC